jgi:hypothetical protein
MSTQRSSFPGYVPYLLIFGLALALRLTQLGAPPLTDPESDWALQALQVAQGAKPLVGSQPAHVLLTSLLFFIFGGTNFLARLWPALAGSILVFVPYSFRERIKPRPALILAFALAFDPGLVALSRQAGSPILAVTFTMLAWATWQSKRSKLAGVFGGLALLSGPSLWAGLLGLGLAWAIGRAMDDERLALNKAKGQTMEEGQKDNEKRQTSGHWLLITDHVKTAIIYCLGTLLLGGTLFFFSPNGLSAWLSALPVYLRGWGTPSGVPAGRLLLTLLAYEPLAIILALIGVVRGWWQGSRHAMRLSLWLLTTLLLALFYPGRQVADLVWMLLPLWALASLELACHLDIQADERIETACVIALTVIILIFAWLDLAALSGMPLPSAQATTRFWLLGGALLLLLMSLLFVALGWSARIAKSGALWGTVIALGVYTLGAAWGATGLRTPSGVELWSPSPGIAQADLLLQTVDDLSDWSKGHINAQPVTIAGVDSPALRWVLRHHTVELADVLDPAATPPLVITAQTDSLGLPAAYRGQDFAWRQTPSWTLIQPANWLSWLTLRQLPQDSENIILWAREDLFPNEGQTNTTP